jgi:hypothetical protein
MWIEIQSLFELKWKYFSRFWSFVELGIIICSWTTVYIYIWRYKESKRISQLFKQTNGYVYINLQLSRYVNDGLTFLFGFCCFFGTIKFVRLCRFNRRLSLFIRTLEHAGKELGLFSLMFSFVFVAFICLFYLLFVSKISSCSSLLKTFVMLFEMILLKFNTKELIETAPFLGPLCFSLFIIFVVSICMNLFLSIINDNFHRVRNNENNDPEILSYMLRKFLRWTGLKKANELEIAEERDTRMRSKYIHPVEYLPDKIDQLIRST